MFSCVRIERVCCALGPQLIPTADLLDAKAQDFPVICFERFQNEACLAPLDHMLARPMFESKEMSCTCGAALWARGERFSFAQSQFKFACRVLNGDGANARLRKPGRKGLVLDCAWCGGFPKY